MSDARTMFADRLRGLGLRRKKYKNWSDSWDHDHCAACWAKISEAEDTLNEGYATCSDYVHGEDYEWVCPTCFAELAEEMGWTEVED